MRAALRVIPFVSSFALSVLAVDAAHARDLPVAGGPGGGSFRLDCNRSGSFFKGLVGLNVKAGAFLDAIGPKCATFLDGGGWGPTTALIKKGGSGGRSQDKECRPENYVAGIKFGFTRDGDAPKYVDYVEVICKPYRGGQEERLCVDTGHRCPDAHPDRPNLKAVTHMCNDDEAAVGIHGRSGIYVDALGLICAPKPAAMKNDSVSHVTVSKLMCIRRGGTWDPVRRRCSSRTGSGGELSADDQAILNAHNGYRAKHCVPNLTWDAQLEKDAQAWASGCKYGHSGVSGENIAWRRPTLSATGVVDSWYGEIGQYDFDNPIVAFNTKKVGHFTQVVWRGSQRLGCAAVMCNGPAPDGNASGWGFMVCRYSPPGNFNINNPGVLNTNVPRLCK
jgi:hypothetical protein